MKLADLSPKQIARARAIFDAATPYGADAVAAALMTAAAESSYWLYANDGTTKRADVPTRARQVARESLNFEYDRVAPNQPPETPAGTWDTTADSVGHFQQRPMYGYGTVAELMDPAESTRIFLRGSKGGRTRYFLASPVSLTLPQRCQWTQGSEYPTGENYEPMATVVAQLISLFMRGRDWLDMATKEEVQAAFAEALSKSDLPEAYRMIGVLLGAFAPDEPTKKIDAEKTIAAQVLAGKIDKNNDLKQTVSDISGRTAGLVSASARIEASLARIEALLSKS